MPTTLIGSQCLPEFRMDTEILYRNIFLDLFKSDNGLLAFTLYSRYGLLPSQAMEFIGEYEKEEVITVDPDLRISLTESGRRNINTILNSLVSKPAESANRPIYYLDTIRSGEPMDCYKPYIPKSLRNPGVPGRLEIRSAVAPSDNDSDFLI